MVVLEFGIRGWGCELGMWVGFDGLGWVGLGWDWGVHNITLL